MRHALYIDLSSKIGSSFSHKEKRVTARMRHSILSQIPGSLEGVERKEKNKYFISTQVLEYLIYYIKMIT